MPQSFSYDLLPVMPLWAIGLVCAVLLLLLVQGSFVLMRKRVPVKWVTMLGVLRLCIIAVFALCLLGPVLSLQHSKTKKPDLLVMIDTSGSMNLPAAGTNESRLGLALSSLRDRGVLDRLARNFELQYYAFDDGARPITQKDLHTLSAKGQTTRLAQSMTDAWQYNQDQASLLSIQGSAASPPQVLVISDGHDSGVTDSAAVASRQGVKVNYLALPESTTDNTQPSRVVISSLQTQPRVLLGSDARFHATLAREDDLPRQVVLALTEDGKAVATQPVTIPSAQRELVVRMDYRPQERGLHKYRMVVLDPNAQDGAQNGGQADAASIESLAQSQSSAGAYELSLAVVDQTVGVLYIEDSYRWSFRYFKRLMEDDPNFGLTSLLSRGGGAYTRFAEPDNQMDVPTFPETAAQLGAIDIIMLGDANPRYWPSSLSRSLFDAVARDGKSLVVVAGPNLQHWTAAPDLLALLPVEITPDTARPVEGPIEIRLSDEARSTAFFADNTGVFEQSLPPLDFIYPPVRKRPAATVLLEATGLSTQEGRMIVMAEHAVGRGRVLYVGTDTLWKWQLQTQPTEEDVTPYTLFWQQAMRAMTPLSRNDAPLQLVTSRTRYEQGQRVELRAMLSQGQLQAGSTMEASVKMPDDQSSPLSFVPDPAQPGVFKATFQASQAGTYRIEATAINQNQPVAEVTAAIDIAPMPGEDSHLGIDEAQLKRIAQATGGQRVEADNPDTWPTTDPQAPQATITTTAQFDLWNHYILMVVLMLLLGADWLIRLLRGYV